MKRKNVVSLGLDLSLVGTGLVILKNGRIIAQHLIKSKPSGDKPIDEVKRIRTIVTDIRDLILYREERVDIAVIEGMAFMAKNTTALVQLAALNYMTRALMVDNDIPFVIVAPTSLKKFITGNGAAKKDVILIELYKRYGVSILNDNEADAYGLSQIGLALRGGNSKDVTKLQKEVLSLLRKQL